MAESDYTPEYVAASKKKQLKPNFFIEIEGVTEKLSKTTVVGLANNIPNVLIKADFSGQSVDINSPKTALKSLTILILDKDNQVTTIFSEKDLHEKTLKLFYSPDETLDFSKYGLKAEYRFKELHSKDGNTYEIRCIETGELLADRLIIGSTIINADIDDSQTTGIIVENSDEFTGSGTIKAYIDEERISFTSVASDGELQGVTRAIDSTTADSHDAGTDFDIYRTVTGVNFVDLMLQLIISEGGGGAFDVLDFGMGIRQELVDITEFESVRDNTPYIVTPTFDIEFKGDEDNFLKFIEDNYLNPSGLRLWYKDDGQISLLVIAEPVPVNPPDILKLDMVKGIMPKWAAKSNRIVNRLVVKVNYNVTTDKFERELVFEDAASIALYGLKRPKKISTRALQTANGAVTFLTTFSNKYFTFYSTPAPELDSVNLMPDKQFFDPGNQIDLSHPDLPNLQTGIRGIADDVVQILGKDFDLQTSITKYKLFYSTLLNFRIGFIAPTGYVAAGSFSTTVFDVGSGDGEKFDVGDVVNIWNDNFASPPVNFSQSTITDIVGDTITVSPAFSVTPVEGYRLRYADFDEVQESQKIYAFVSITGGGDFGDGSKSYKIGA